MKPLVRFRRPRRAGVVQAAAESPLPPSSPRPSHLHLSDARRGLILDDRYRLHERVGSGGMATVYRGQDLLLDEDVAVKIMHEVLAGEQDVVERFRREARTAEHLRHQNIVRAFDHGLCDGMHYIVMEHVSGPSVKTLIANEAPLEPARAIHITLQILAAARFIHDRGIIHRDLKPGNVLMSGEQVAKITDFGIASYGGADITPAESFLGTVHYLSPERMTGAATQASDVYSIGIILYELLTGRLPFEGELVTTVARQHQNERPVPPACLNDAITDRLNAVVLRALEKSPQDRMPDCRTFAAALRRAMHGSATMTKSPAVAL